MNKLVDELNNIYHCSIGKKPINAGYSALSEKIEPKLKLLIESELLYIIMFLVKVLLEIGQKTHLLLILC